MSGISGLVGNALTGLEAAQAALQVTGNNISNVNTPGYNREQAIQTTLTPTLFGGNYLGNGTQVSNVTRSYNTYLQSQVWNTTAAASGASTYDTQIQSIVNLLAGTDSGLSTAINQFFASGVAGVAANPSDLPSRQSMIDQSQSLAQSFQNAAAQLQTASTGVNQQIAQSITSINDLTQQIAKLNIQINNLSGSNAQPNSLLDQRDQLVSQLSAQVGVTVLQSGTQYSVYAGNGQVLVAGGQSFDLQTASNPYDPQQTEVAYASNGSIISNTLSGGALGGLLQFRSQVLQPAQNALGQLAAGIAQEFNNQQASGLDMNGNAGAALFQAGAVQVLGNSNNTGSAVISGSITDVSQLTTADYKLSYGSSGAWTITNLSTGSSTTTSGTTSGGVTTLSFDGVQVNVSGAAAGDSFEVQPTRYAALNFQSVLTDPSGIAAASPYVSTTGALQSGSVVNSNLGNLTLSAGAYSSGTAAALAASGAVVLGSGSATVPTALQVTLTSGGTSGQSVGFQITQSGSSTVLASGTMTLASSGTSIAVPYANNPPGGYWTVTLAGSTAVSGDAFTMSAGGPGNGGNAATMSALQTTKYLNNGKASLEDAYGQLVSTVATQGSQSQSALSAATASATQATAAQQSVSGVNLDEEASKLIQYQQAYQAAAKAIQIGNSLFSSLLQAVQ